MPDPPQERGWPEVRIIRRANGEWTIGFLEAVGPDDESRIYKPASLLEAAEEEREEARHEARRLHTIALDYENEHAKRTADPSKGCDCGGYPLDAG